MGMRRDQKEQECKKLALRVVVHTLELHTPCAGLGCHAILSLTPTKFHPLSSLSITKNSVQLFMVVYIRIKLTKHNRVALLSALHSRTSQSLLCAHVVPVMNKKREMF